MPARLRFVSALLAMLVLPAVLLPPPPVRAASQTVRERLAEEFGSGCAPGESPRELYLTRPALRGSDVRELQSLLRAQGYDPGPADGLYGPRTHAAVVRYQGDAGLQEGGRVTEATWQSLAGAFPTAQSDEPPKPPPTGKVLVVIDVPSRTLTLVEDGVPYASFPVAVGTEESPTPVGEWRVVEKSSGWGGGFGVRWLGLNVPWGTYGIHGTNKPWSIGRPLSAGCVRMHNDDVVNLWDWVPMGTQVIILGPHLHIPEWAKEPMGPGADGWVVLEVQRRLRERGYEVGTLDGRYGHHTEQAVRSLQRVNGLGETGRVDASIYRLLGM